MNLDRSKLPKAVLDKMVTQDDESLILDPQITLIEFFGSRDLSKGDIWESIKAYTNWLFKEKIQVLQRKNDQLKEANHIAVDEIKYLLNTNAEFITIIKNRCKDVDVVKITRDVRQKIEAQKRERERLATQDLLTKAAIAAEL